MKLPLVVLFFLFSVVIASAQECYVETTSGGGFTGAATQYKITPDGKVMRGKGISDIQYAEEATLKKSVARRYIRKSEKLLKDLDASSHPGNLHYTLHYYDKKMDKSITWGDTAQQTPQTLKDLYQEIATAVNALPFKPLVAK